MGNLARLADDAGDAVRQTIRAYHGSPRPTHFDRFDSSHIGTGEGAQAYGHGMYFAGNKDVADDYRRSLSVKEFRRRFDQAGIPHDADFDDVMDAIEAFDPRQQELLRRLNEEGFLGFDYPSQAISESLNRDMPARYEVSPELIRARDQVGTGYEVELGATEESLLNWDRPTGPTGGVGAKAAEVLRAVRPSEISSSALSYIRRMRPGEYAKPAAGSELYDVERALQRLARDAEGSVKLLEAGIPGVRYLDGDSRHAGSGTRNYVMFPGTEDKIRILSKYAVPPLIAAVMQGEDR